MYLKKKNLLQLLISTSFLHPFFFNSKLAFFLFLHYIQHSFFPLKQSLYSRKLKKKKKKRKQYIYFHCTFRFIVVVVVIIVDLLCYTFFFFLLPGCGAPSTMRLTRTNAPSDEITTFCAIFAIQ